MTTLLILGLIFWGIYAWLTDDDGPGPTAPVTDHYAYLANGQQHWYASGSSR